MDDSLLGIVMVVVGVGLYFLPTIAAACKKHKNTQAIFALNCFLGWTFIGWVVALIWQATDGRKTQYVVVHQVDKR